MMVIMIIFKTTAIYVQIQTHLCFEGRSSRDNIKKIIHLALDVLSFPFSAPLGYVSNFKVTSYTSTTIDVEWSPIVGATEYKLTWTTGDIFI